MISITIIGSGNMAQHLIKAISNCDTLELVQVFARNKDPDSADLQSVPTIIFKTNLIKLLLNHYLNPDSADLQSVPTIIFKTNLIKLLLNHYLNPHNFWQN